MEESADHVEQGVHSMGSTLTELYYSNTATSIKNVLC
jgi:hypothetical protein